MKKLFRLREWLTVDEAARHLSSVLEEEVGPSDILRMGLDGHLTLSVNFVNKTQARLGRVVPFKDLPVREVPQMGPGGQPTGEMVLLPGGVLIDEVEEVTEETRFLRLDEAVVSIDGVWDLAMLGAERHDIEHAFQALADGPAIELACIEGAFVARPDGQWANLQERMPDRNVDTTEGKKRQKQPFYYPAPGLPSDAPIVVRTTAIAPLLARLQEPPSEAGRESVGTRERDTLLKLVIGMAIGGYGYQPTSKRSATASDIVADLAKQGLAISDDTVRSYLKEAAEKVLPQKPNS